MEEFCLKIRAAKESQTDPLFSVVARVEALIAGWGMDEALARAHAYRDAGADAILIHSKEPDAHQITEFMRAWHDAGPVVVVPTMYPQTPTEHFEDLGVSLVIWANHLIRASISAMQAVAQKIWEARSLTPVESDIASVAEVFRLQNAAELQDAEVRYLPKLPG